MNVHELLPSAGRPERIAKFQIKTPGIFRSWFSDQLWRTRRRLSAAKTLPSNFIPPERTKMSQALDVYDGVHAVLLMTIHKSKGLEYHTVIFVGLDDDAWFAFQKQTKEETCGFFVAFTRAKQRVVFSYCSSRAQRNAVAPLYTLLKSAGVQTIAK
jgi:superfamily I DNA/RNA helicase